MRYALLIPLVLSTSLIACGPGNVRDFTHARDTEALTEAESRRWYAAEKLDESLRNKGLVYSDEDLRRYLQDVMDRLYPEFRGGIRVYPADSPLLNAFALPNGSIYVNIGLIARMHNEAQLATVLAHEAAHFVEQHSLKQRESLDSVAIASISVTLMTGIPLSGDLLAAGFLSGYSQEFERAADRKGFHRLAAAGYDTTEAAEVFRIMLEEVEALEIDQPFLYSSHPRLEERIQTLTQLTQEHTGHTGEKAVGRFNRLTTGLREAVLQRYLRQQDYKRLVLILGNEKRRARYPGHARFYLGEAYRLRNQEDDNEKAIEAYLESTREAPEYPANYRALGILYMKSGDSSKAIDYFERYLELARPGDETAYVRSYLTRLRDRPND